MEPEEIKKEIAQLKLKHEIRNGDKCYRCKERFTEEPETVQLKTGKMIAVCYDCYKILKIEGKLKGKYS